MTFDKVANIFTWGRIAFLVIVGAAGFATFVAGEISGARGIEPRVTALEKWSEQVDLRLSTQGETLAEIRGYVRAIADKMGVRQGGEK